nr:hypothetical protein [Marseillevirus cajuinensis]
MLFRQKQPLNPIEGPIQPCIKKDPPRFVEAGKAWTVNPGDIILDNAENPYLVDGTVLAVARDRNKTQYGQRSYTFKVNKNFRPPLIDRDDLVPLSRLPRPTTQYRNNPSIPFQTMNPISVEGLRYVKQQRCADGIRPSFFHRVEEPQPDVIVDLSQKLPTISAEAPKSTPVFLSNECVSDPNIRKIGWEVTLRNKGAVQPHLNSSVPVSLHQETQQPELEHRNPKVFAGAGATFCLRENGTMGQSDLELSKRNPSVFANAGREWFTRFDVQQPDVELELHNPSVFASAGEWNPVKYTNSSRDIELERRNPSVFADSRKEFGVNVNTSSPDIFLEQKRPTVSVGAGKSQPLENIQERNVELKQRVLHTNASTGRRAMEFGNPEHSIQAPTRLANRVSTSADARKEAPVKETPRNEHVSLRQTLEPNKGNTYTSHSALPQFVERRSEPRLRGKEKLKPMTGGNWS